MSRAVIPLAITFVILGQVGADLYLPSFSAMSSELGVAPEYIELSLSLFLLSMAVSQLFYGALSDALGRRRVILPALLLYALGSAVCFFASGIAQLLVGRQGQRRRHRQQHGQHGEKPPHSAAAGCSAAARFGAPTR